MIRNSLILLASVLFLTSCGTINDVRDNLAYAIETEERRTAPDRVRIVPEYVPVPDQFLGEGACPPPSIPSPEEIARMTWEGEYNERVVAPLYSNNEMCYLNNQRIIRFNDIQLQNNAETKGETGNSAESDPK